MRLLKDILGDPPAIAGFIIVSAYLIIALFAPWIAPHDPLEINLRKSQTPPAWSDGGSMEYILGTDMLGRDLASRIIFGSRVSITISFLGILGSCLVGLFLGLISGYYGGWIGDLIMRIVDIQLGIPFILLAIFVVSILGPSLRNVILIFALLEYPIFARITRGEVLRLKQEEFTLAAHVVGGSNGWIILRHILPNLLDTIVITATLEVGLLILYEAALGFLGLGVAPPVPTWGNMLADGSELLTTSWWVATFPGFAILLLVMGVGFVGDWAARVLDPMGRKK